MQLYSKTTGTELFKDDLNGLLALLSGSGADADPESTGEIEILLSFNAATATVTVFGWAVIVYDGPIYG